VKKLNNVEVDSYCGLFTHVFVYIYLFAWEPIKASTYSMNEIEQVITDTSEVLPAFCQSIEAILRQGLKKGLGNLGLADRDYWNVIQDLTSSKRITIKPSHSVSHVVGLVQHSKSVHTSQSRGRLFIRIALSKGLLAETIQCLLNNQEYVKYWYKDFSMLVNYQEKRVLIEILKSLKMKTYNLNINNCHFLGETWLVPEIECFEFVPCSLLGLTLFTVHNKCMIIDVQSNSVAAEKGIQTGDCLASLYDEIIDERTALKIAQIRKKNQGKPVTVIILKGRFKDGRWFSPLFQRYNILLNNGKCQAVEEKENTMATDQTDHQMISAKHAFDVTYQGVANVGKKGNCIYVQEGIKKLNKVGDHENTKLKLQLSERDIVLYSSSTGEVAQRFSYTETSSCALGDENDCQFGFITGNTTCSFADSFNCHVFLCATPHLARTIIEGIGKGFDRTVYCV